MGATRSPMRLLAALLLLLLTACATGTARRYYSFTVPTSPPATQVTPLPMTVWFQQVEVGPTYNRTQIVYRYSEYELQYFANRLWADRPERMLQNVIATTLSNARVFESFQERITDHAPTHVLTAHVDALEELVGQGTHYAHLALTLRLATYDGGVEVWRYRIDRTRPVPADATDLTVRALSELLEQELERAIEDLRVELGEERPPQVAGLSEAPVLTPLGLPLEDELPFSLTQGELAALKEGQVSVPEASEWMDSPQYNADDTVLPARSGAIFVPALSGDGSREPTVLVVRSRGEAERREGTDAPPDEDVDPYARGQTGRRIVVEPGLYRVYIGSGTLGQRMSRDVVVLEGRVTVVEPFWSALDVSVLDDRFVPVRESYELFAMGLEQVTEGGVGGTAGTSLSEQGYYGTGFGADAELGEQTRVWLLEPGLYKLVQLGSNYRARTNFATVYLLEGELTAFNLVIDPDTGAFLGAGVALQTTEEEPGEERRRATPWTTSLTLGGDLLFAYNTSAVGQQEGSSVTATLFTDALAQYLSGSHRWITRGEIEESQNRTPDSDFRSRADRLYVHSIYIYDLRDKLGPYVRAGAESTLLPHNYYLAEAQDVPILDPSGELVETLPDAVSFQLSPALSPLDLREGAGVNFQVVRSVPLELSARLGLGSRQFVVRSPGYLLTPITDRDGGLVAAQEVFGSRLGGVELTLVGTARITRYIQLRSELDALVPRRPTDTYFNWRTITSLRLSSFASLNHRLELTRDTNQSIDQPLAVTNILQLQFFYKPF